MHEVYLLYRLLAVILGLYPSEIEDGSACWQSLRKTDTYEYVCQWDGIPTGAHLDEQNDQRQLFVGREWNGELRVIVNWSDELVGN